MTKTEREQYAKLARYGCILCRQKEVRNLEDSPVEMHHIRRHGGLRKNAPVIPLCAYHHRLGNSSIHQLGHSGFKKYWNLSEEDLLEKMNDLLQKKG